MEGKKFRVAEGAQYFSIVSPISLAEGTSPICLDSYASNGTKTDV